MTSATNAGRDATPGPVTPTCCADASTAASASDAAIARGIEEHGTEF
jgi:hypothetical protein